jgi:diguanylate cyclase (GGDEF)-like protein/PAS domain S-box-containing protein
MPPRANGLSFGMRLFLLAAAVLTLVSAGEIYNGLRLRASRLQEVRNETLQLARVAALDMDDTLAGAHQVLATLARLPVDNIWDARACEVMAAIVEGSLEYDHIAAVGLDGKVLCSSGGPVTRGVAIADRDVFDRALATGDFAVGSLGGSAFSGNELLPIAHPIVDARGATVGAVYAGIKATWLDTEIDQWQLPRNISLTITDRSGIVIARHPGARAMDRRLPDNLLQLLAGKSPGTVEAIGIDGALNLFGYLPAGIGPARGFAVLVGLDKAAVVAEIDRAILTSLAIVFLALLVSGVAFWIYVRRVVGRPLEGLLKAAGLWRTGDWTARAAAVSGIPEFDRLSTAFNEMAGAVAARDGSLAYRDSILHTISRCAAGLLEERDLKKAIPQVLEMFGEAVFADRIIILQTSASDQSKVFQHVWHGPSSPVPLTAAYIAAIPPAALRGLQDWSKSLHDGKVIATSYEDTGAHERELFDALKIVSNLQAPIFVDGSFWGQMMIDDCHRSRAWTPTEVDALKVLANLIGASIARQRRLEKLSAANQVVRNSPAILFRIAVDCTPPRLVYVSDNIASLGHDAEALIAEPDRFWSLVHPDDDARVRASLAAIAKGLHGDHKEFRLATAAGPYIWTASNYGPLHDDRGRVTEVAGVIMDITARKEAEDKLQFINKVLATQSETSPDGILVVDENQKIISFNRRFAEVLGVPKRLIPDTLSDPIDDEPILSAVVAAMKDPDAFLARVRHLYAHPEESSHDELETSDGRFIDRHTAGMRAPDGRYLGRVWFFRDVTEARKAQRELEESEIRFRTVLQATGDAILVIDLETLRPILGNQAACKMLGYPLEELLTAHVDMFFSPEDAAERARVRARVAAGESLLTPNVRIRGSSGAELIADIFATPMVLAGQTYLVAAFHEVTERNRTEIALTREHDFSTAIIDNLPGLFFVTDPAGRLIRFNAGLVKRSRSPMESIQGMDVLTNVVAEDRDLAAAKIREARASGHAEAEIGVYNNVGEARRYLFTIGRLELADGPGVLGIGIDVTEARRSERLLQESEQRFRAIFASVSDGIIVHDFDTGAIVDANQSVCDMFGYTRSEIAALDIADLSSGIAPYGKDDIQQRFAAARSGEAQNFEWQCKAKDGRLFSIEVTLRQVAFGDTRYLLSTARDITARKRDEAVILQMARTDSLTGLPNRRVFAEAVQQAIGRAHRGGKGFAIIYLDLDHFKDVNDTLGHAAGDALLKQVAERLKAGVRDTDTVARFGGDEFAVLETDIDEPTDAGVLAAKLMQVIGEPFAVDESEVRSGASFGIAVYGPDADDAESLLSRADVALYRAKSEGRGTYRFFTEAMDTEVRNRVELGNELRAAIGTGQIFLAYQPQVEIDTGRIVGVEALVRWDHPRRGVVSPAEFIPAAEKNGLIVALGHWVLWEACRQAREWRDAGVAPDLIGVNLSALQFKTPMELENDIERALREAKLPRGMLELEITETVLMDASLEHNDVLVRLRASGVRLAIDDFGTGYSSLDYLRRFPMDRIKIAQNFVLDLGTKPGSAAVVKATIGLAHELGIDIIAEGVETEEQLQLLRQWGCGEAQGYLYARPLTAEQVLPLLRAGRIVRTPHEAGPAPG